MPLQGGPEEEELTEMHMNAAEIHRQVTFYRKPIMLNIPPGLASVRFPQHALGGRKAPGTQLDKFPPPLVEVAPVSLLMGVTCHHEVNIRSGGKTVPVVFKDLPRSLP